jgi:3-hydroxybutyryl-CoA dehydrogenase
VDEIRRIGVVGGGVMGSGLAYACGKAGLDVLVAVSSTCSQAAAERRIHTALDQAVRKGKLRDGERAAVVERISYTTELDDLADRQLVIEAVIEHAPTKMDVFAALDGIVKDPQAILASTTSAIPIMRLGGTTSRAEQVLGLHFFNPVPINPLVELTASLLSDDCTCARAESFVTQVLGKQVVRSKDRPGFVVNVLLVPYLMSAMRVVEAGHATPETIDKAVVLGCAHPMGPLKLADLVGLDTLVDVGKALYDEYKEPQYAPPPLLSRMVEGGLLGLKSGRGFYDYL